ncbi:MAG: 2-dehydropantoate 2-reductase, partial [Bdellovibrionota bacterium]
GEDVVFLARGAQLEALRRGPLVIESEGKPSVEVRVRAVDAQEFRKEKPFDLVLWCVKAYQNEEAAEGLSFLVSDRTWWLPLQNGVETEDFLLRKFPKARVLGGTCYVSALLESPGKVRHYASGIITMGDWGLFSPEETARVLEDIRQVFTKAGITAWTSKDIRADKWKKLIWNASLNSLSAISGASATELLAQEPARELVRKAMYEVVDVARAHGISLSHADADKHITTTMALPDVRTSMRFDRERGAPVEGDALCGVVVRLGKEKGAPTPTLAVFKTLLDLYEEKRRAISRN